MAQLSVPEPTKMPAMDQGIENCVDHERRLVHDDKKASWGAVSWHRGNTNK